MLIDTHAHYDDKQFDIDRDELLKELFAQKLELIVNVGCSIDSIKHTLELVKRYPNMYGTVGVHPSDTAELTDEKLAWIKEVSQTDKIVAIGEIGLDYYWDEPDVSIQKTWFDRQMQLAKEVNLPVSIHSRDAAKDTLDMMISARAKEIGGVIHCFSYGKEMAKEFLNMGFYLGIGGVVTFKNGKKLKEVVEYSPMDRLVLETDCPYLSPEPNRGKRNQSFNLEYVAREIASIKQMEYEEVLRITNENAKRLYRIKK